MAKQDNYYYISSEMDRYKTSFFKWNERYSSEVVENYELVQAIDICLIKLGEKLDKPKNESFRKVKPVLKEIFNDHYAGALSIVAKKVVTDWEFYLTHNKVNWIKVEAYSSLGAQVKGCIQFELVNSGEQLEVSLFSSKQLRGRPMARKKGSPISHELFMQFLNPLLKFLSDHNSILIYYEELCDKFLYLAGKRENSANLFDVSPEKSFDQIISQLMQRKEVIEKRLIENDDDTKDERLHLRGELAGIEYSLRTINIYQ
ncbi:hypothetical protein [Mangrovibacterium diazotrophicum]|uniref:Uncharacterized protein n=1 Tax=Mangrovibacterium diazotrophicum TaxID=1261403 RepID=A0A419W3J2_9BACT|nr:hypothetical protein [Mangrovibacterium diazotrophicum]RKD90042.1 hypothetical protein BC643_0378 [Mangrovibacterium diazotrophicum]